MNAPSPENPRSRGSLHRTAVASNPGTKHLDTRNYCYYNYNNEYIVFFTFLSMLVVVLAAAEQQQEEE